MTNEQAVAISILRYGGFWIRVVATLIDGFILGIALGLLGAATGLDFFADDPDHIFWLAIAVQHDRLTTSRGCTAEGLGPS